jgi:hypothetical protein
MRLHTCLHRICCAIALLGFSLTCIAAEPVLAPFSGFARSFLSDNPISDATVTILETKEQFHTDAEGKFGPIMYPVGKPLTLVFEKFGFKTTQTETVIMPKEGLTDRYNNLTFQVPSIEAFYLISMIVGAKLDSNSCHVATTITAYHKTLDDVPQIEPNARVTLSVKTDEIPFYFDIFKEGPLKGKTNPFTRGLTETTEDGGVAFFNLPPRPEPYTHSLPVLLGRLLISARLVVLWPLNKSDQKS